MRVADRVDETVLVEQRVHRQLVEDDHDHRRVRADRRRRGGRGPGERQPRRVGVQQEEREEDQRRRRQHGQQHPRRRQAEVESGRAEPDRAGDRRQEPARRAEGPDRLEREQADEARDQERVQDAAAAARDHRLQPEQERGRHEAQDQREQDDVRARRARAPRRTRRCGRAGRTAARRRRTTRGRRDGAPRPPAAAARASGSAMAASSSATRSRKRGRPRRRRPAGRSRCRSRRPRGPARCDRDDDLAARRGEAGEVARVGVDVVDDLGLPARGGRAADALADRDPHVLRRLRALATGRARGRRPRRGRCRPRSSARTARAAGRPSCCSTAPPSLGVDAGRSRRARSAQSARSSRRSSSKSAIFERPHQVPGDRARAGAAVESRRAPASACAVHMSTSSSTR